MHKPGVVTIRPVFVIATGQESRLMRVGYDIDLT